MAYLPIHRGKEVFHEIVSIWTVSQPLMAHVNHLQSHLLPINIKSHFWPRSGHLHCSPQAKKINENGYKLSILYSHRKHNMISSLTICWMLKIKLCSLGITSCSVCFLLKMIKAQDQPRCKFKIVVNCNFNLNVNRATPHKNSALCSKRSMVS